MEFPQLQGGSQNNSEWLYHVLGEVGLQQFYPKIVNDLQVTRLFHFDYVSEADLTQIGMSRPAARRLLAAIKKRRSFITALKNKIVNKFIPLSATNPNHTPPVNHNSSAKTFSNNHISANGLPETGSKLSAKETNNRDLNIVNTSATPNFSKSKGKSKFLKLFSSDTNQQTRRKGYNQMTSTIVRSQSDELPTPNSAENDSEDGPLLIDLSDDAGGLPPAHRSISTTFQSDKIQQSLIDMDYPANALPRFASLTAIDRIEEDEGNYISLEGSWNTGTFYDSSNNIYSQYYCPLDATNAIAPTNNVYDVANMN